MPVPLHNSTREVLKSIRFASAYGMSRRNLRRKLVSHVVEVLRAKANEVFCKYFRKSKQK